jgi:GntR family transcriptional regulator
MSTDSKRGAGVRRRRAARVRERKSARERVLARLAALRPGDRLPAEPQLAAELDVSRPTLREALRSAQDAGLIFRRPGVGTVKTHSPSLVNDLSINTGVTDLIRAHGLDPGTRDMTVDLRLASGEQARRLALSRPARVWVVDRVRTADGMPVIASRDVAAEAVFKPRELTPDALAKRSVYGYLSDKGLAVHHGVASIHPHAADADLARSLEVSEGTLLLQLIQVDYDVSGRPLLLSYEHHLPDAFEFTVSRRGPAPGAAEE